MVLLSRRREIATRVLTFLEVRFPTIVLIIWLHDRIRADHTPSLEENPNTPPTAEELGDGIPPVSKCNLRFALARAPSVAQDAPMDQC